MSNQNFTTRPLTLDDAQQFVDTHKAISTDVGTNRSYQADFIQSQWQEPDFDLSQSSQGIFTQDGQLVGYSVIWDNQTTPVQPWIEWGVHPDYLDHHLSSQLLQWSDKISQRIIDKCPPDVRLTLRSGAKKGYKPTEDALNKAGYKAIRSGYEMRIDMESPPPAPNLPDGIRLRNYKPDKDLAILVDTFRDSFSDHFGYVEQPFEKDMEEFRHWFSTDKLIDPTLIFLAIDEATDTVVGYIVGLKAEHGDPTVGYIELVGVRRAYRRRGLAQAMMYHAFNAYWNRDQKSVTLGVDGESLTNAVKLYERVGMHIYHEYVQYAKVIREGRELATVAVEE